MTMDNGEDDDEGYDDDDAGGNDLQIHRSGCKKMSHRCLLCHYLIM